MPFQLTGTLYLLLYETVATFVIIASARNSLRARSSHSLLPSAAFAAPCADSITFCFSSKVITVLAQGA